MKLDKKSVQTAITQLLDDYKFSPEEVINIIKQWIKSWFKKDFPQYKKADIIIDLEWDWTITIYQQLTAVKEVEDKSKEISIKEAKKIIEDDVEEWEDILVDITPQKLELSRIASQVAWQTILQQLKNIEREKFFEKFQNKEWELLKAKVIRNHKDSVILDIEWTSVVLPTSEQISNRIYEPNEEIFVLLKQISKWQWGINLNITQASEDYIEAILKKIVPELDEWTIEIKDIARIPWKKTKIIVKSNDENIDPVWVMIWKNWDRINTVLSLLDWEKIDYIEENEDEIKLIKDLLKPAKINSVEIKEKKAFVYLDANQKAMAIWKWASNVRLASILSWYTIEIV